LLLPRALGSRHYDEAGNRNSSLRDFLGKMNA